MIKNIYEVRIESNSILTPTKVREALGIGYKVLSVEVKKDIPELKLETIHDAFKSILKVGYRALVRAYHPDVGGDTEKMMLINRAHSNEVIRIDLIS